MKKIILVLTSLIFMANTLLADAPTMIGGDVAYKNQYVWRGIQFNEESVLWPDIWINWNNFTIIGFGSLDLTESNEMSGRLTEFDVFLEYAHEFKNVSLTLGYVHYSFPWQLDSTNEIVDNGFSIGKGTGEIYSTLSTNFNVVNLSTSIWIDIFNVRGVYFNPALTVSHTFNEALTPELSVGIGVADTDHNAYWIGEAKSGITDLLTTLNISYALPGKLRDYASVAVDVNYSEVIDEDLKNALKASNVDTGNFWFGLSLNGFFAPQK